MKQFRANREMKTGAAIIPGALEKMLWHIQTTKCVDHTTKNKWVTSAVCGDSMQEISAGIAKLSKLRT